MPPDIHGTAYHDGGVSPRHLRREWQCFPDLFSAPMPLHLAGALVHQLNVWWKVWACVEQGRAQQQSSCTRIGPRKFEILMREGFTAGELLHEYTHVAAFIKLGDRHTHVLPRDRKDRSCAWPQGRPLFERGMFRLCRWFIDSDHFPALLDAQSTPA